MIADLALRSATREGGFTIIELLIAMTITLIIAAAIAAAAPPARDAFERVPADLDLQQRGRTAIEALSQTIRSAGANVAATESLGLLSDVLPSLSVAGEDESGFFTELTAIIPVTNAAQGLLALNQSAPGAALTLAIDHCPNVKDACGFTPGSTAVVADGAGHFDVFAIGVTNAGARRVTPASPLSRAYPAGSVIVEADQLTFGLAEQPDGHYSLVRTTAAGAVQPIVDFANGLAFDVIGRDVAAGFFQIQQVDIWLSVEAPTDSLRRVIPDRVFRTSIRLRNVP
jgi:prepilin-type N-terminal cleavage/methylation domain-containing protein